MMDRAGAVANAALLVYAAGHLDAFLEMITDDITYALYVDQDVLPFAGETQGKAAFRERIAQMQYSFEYVLYRPLGVRAVGYVAHTQVEFMYRHRASQEILSGRFRLVLTVRGDLISRIEEYHDAERVKAFIRLVGGVEPE